MGVPQTAASNSLTVGNQPAAIMSGARHIQRKALAAAEGGVFGRRQMLDASDVRGPVDVLRIYGTAAPALKENDAPVGTVCVTGFGC